MTDQPVPGLPGPEFDDVGPRCPYCQRQYVADGPEYHRHDNTPIDCDQCGKRFISTVEHTATWTTEPIEEAAKAL